MYRKIVPIDQQSILVEWDSNFSLMEIKMDGNLIGSIEGKDAIMQGRSFLLPDNSHITVLYRDMELEVWRNGKELVSGDEGGGIAKFYKAASALKWVGIFQMAVAPLFLIKGIEDAVWWLIASQILFGGILLGLSIWAKKARTKVPYGIGLGFCLVIIVSNVASGIFKGFLIILILAYYLIEGLRGTLPEAPVQTFADSNAPLDSGL